LKVTRGRSPMNSANALITSSRNIHFERGGDNDVLPHRSMGAARPSRVVWETLMRSRTLISTLLFFVAWLHAADNPRWYRQRSRFRLLPAIHSQNWVLS
jgi:hypothetical protein